MTRARVTLAGLALCAALGLPGCSREQPPQTAGQKVDATIEAAKDRLDAAARSAADAAKATGRAIGDSAITASVKAQFAADPDLQSLEISVETHSGLTSLRGTAPDEAARHRATQLASAVSGVSGVDNHLTITP